MKKVEPKFRKVTLNVPTKIWKQLEERQEENGTSITNEILNLVRFGLKQEMAVDMMPTIVTALNKQKPTKKRQI